MVWFQGSMGTLAVACYEHDGRGVVVWTDLIHGKRECIGIEIMPLSDGWTDEVVERAREWVTSGHEASEPITRVWLQNVPLGEMMLKAAKQLRGLREMATSQFAKPLSPQGRALRDALHYLALVRDGNPSPARDLADQWGVSLATARARVADVRKLGVLTSAGAGILGGELTEFGLDLLRREINAIDVRWRHQLRSLARDAGVELGEED